MTSPRALVSAAVLAAALALSACGSDDDGDTTSAGGPTGESGALMKETTPAEIVDDPHGFVSTDVLYPLENAWRVSSPGHFTEVDAGALARDSSTGALAIFRQDYAAVTQETNLVKVPGAGALTITSAPTDDEDADTAQESGVIEFEGSEGVTGSLDLSDDSVSVDE